MINLLLEENKKILRREYHMRFASIVLALLSLACVFTCILLVPSYLFSSSKVTLAETRLATWNTINKDITVLDTSGIIADTNMKLALLHTATQSNVSDLVLGQVLSLRISGVTFTQILYNNRADGVRVVEIHGTARDRAVLRAFKDTLDKSALFSSVAIPLSTFLERSNIPFTVSLVLK